MKKFLNYAGEPRMCSKEIDQGIYRILDANLDRAAEGLRVVMDVARFSLDDSSSSEQLRQIRHSLLAHAGKIPRFNAVRLISRESESDVGQGLGHGSPGRDLPGVFGANIHRAQEAVRSLEEFSRSFSPSAADGFSQCRYELYHLEKQLQPRVDALGCREKMDFDLYVVTGPELSRSRELEEVVSAALRGGAGAIQLRAKHFNKRQLLTAARNLRRLTEDSGATFIINDHIDIALSCGADGVHLGQEDLPVPEARAIAGSGMLIGTSTHNVEEALQAEKEGAGYINVGPVFPTKTKDGVVNPVGCELIGKVLQQVNIPQTCMGGIHSGNVRQTIMAGAERIAVVSAVVAADDIEKAARELVEKIHQAKEERDHQ
jgi:thiamine-phosphate pyrophosphorylase